LLKDGVATKLSIADGIYRESWFELNAEKVGGKAQDTLLVVEGQSTDGVQIRGSEVSGFEPANWTLIDKARNIYRIEWTKTELSPVPKEAWSSAIQAISRHRVMVFVNGVMLKPVQLEQYRHEKTREEKDEREHGGISTRRTIVDTYTGFTGLDAMTPGTIAVNTLGPGENTFGQHPHDRRDRAGNHGSTADLRQVLAEQHPLLQRLADEPTTSRQQCLLECGDGENLRQRQGARRKDQLQIARPVAVGDRPGRRQRLAKTRRQLPASGQGRRGGRGHTSSSAPGRIRHVDTGQNCWR